MQKAVFLRMLQINFPIIYLQDHIPNGISREEKCRSGRKLFCLNIDQDFHELVKDYKVTLYRKNKIAAEREIKDNGQRLNVLKFDSVVCDEVRITVLGTHGCKNARIFEVRVY